MHRRCRAPFLVLGLLCLLFPLHSLRALVLFGCLLGLLLVPTVAWCYGCARAAYAAKFGTTRVVSAGWLRYAPPPEHTDRAG